MSHSEGEPQLAAPAERPDSNEDSGQPKIKKLIINKVKLPSDYFGFLMSLEQQVEKRGMVLAGVVDHNYQGKLDYCSTWKVWKRMSGIQAIP